MLELHHGPPNGCHLKPLILLKERGIPFESRPYDPGAFPLEDAPFAREPEVAFNLEREGPVLVDEGRAVTDALFMNLYLDETHPGPRLAPATPEGHWALLMWGRFVGEVLAPAVHSLGCAAWPPAAGHAAIEALESVERRSGWLAATGGESEAVLADSRRKAGLAVRKIELALDPGPWLLGADYTLADIEVFGHALSLPKLVPELANPAGSPRLIAWLARMHARPAVQAALAVGGVPHPEEVFIPGPEHSRWG
jgi:glutathione S-transferase